MSGISVPLNCDSEQVARQRPNVDNNKSKCILYTLYMRMYGMVCMLKQFVVNFLQASKTLETTNSKQNANTENLQMHIFNMISVIFFILLEIEFYFKYVRLIGFLCLVF
jgi:hypothetical protein